MKIKNKANRGFTLAEVLITLTVVGVLGMLVMSSLWVNTQERQWKSAFKSNYTSIRLVFLAVQSKHKGTLRNLCPSEAFDDGASNCAGDMLANYLKYIKHCSAGTAITGGCWYDSGVKLLKGTEDLTAWHYANNTNAFVLNNGAILSVLYKAAEQDCDDGVIERCGLSRIYIDVNGNDGPNTVGQDVFGAHITAKGLYPFGAGNVADGSLYGDGSGQKCIMYDTSAANYGYACSARVLQGIDY